MSRRRRVAKRDVLPEPKYHSQMLAKFINVVMISGKKSSAEKVVYGALDIVKQNIKKNKGSDEDVLVIFQQCLDNVRPLVEVKARRVGGATYQVPDDVRPERSIALGMRWIVKVARVRSEKGMVLRLAAELTEAYDNKGSAVKKREETHKMAKANQAFAHFRW
jgi:small subunit ribosomal protein S7